MQNDYKKSNLCPCQSPPCNQSSRWGTNRRGTKLRSKRTLDGYYY